MGRAAKRSAQRPAGLTAGGAHAAIDADFVAVDGQHAQLLGSDFEHDLWQVHAHQVPEAHHCQGPRHRRWPRCLLGRPAPPPIAVTLMHALSGGRGQNQRQHAQALLALALSQQMSLDSLIESVPPPAPQGSWVERWVGDDAELMEGFAPFLGRDTYGQLRRLTRSDGIYLGLVDRDEQRHGQGIHYQREGRRIAGSWLNDRPCDSMQLTLGDAHWHGPMDEHLWRHGKGTLWLADGTRLVATWQHDHMQAPVAVQWADGRTYLGSMASECAMVSGTGTLVLTNKSRLSATFVRQQVVGDGQLRFATGYLAGMTYRGPFMQLQPHGAGQLLNDTGRTISCCDFDRGVMRARNRVGRATLSAGSRRQPPG